MDGWVFRPRKTTAVNVSFQQNNAIGSGSEAAEPQSAGGAAAVSTGGLTVTLHNLWADYAVALQKRKYPKMQQIGDRFGVSNSVDDSYKTAIDQMQAHPDLKGFGRDNRIFFWLRHGDADSRAAHVGFVASSTAEVDVFYQAAMAAGATDNGKPSARHYYDPRYYAANVLDPDGYSLEAVYKSWQHPQR